MCERVYYILICWLANLPNPLYLSTLSSCSDILWVLPLSSKISKKFICYLYRSLQVNNIHELIRNLSQTIDHLNSEYSSEVIMRGKFNVNSEAWIRSNKTNTKVRTMDAFDISIGFSQLGSRHTLTHNSLQ